MELYGNFLISSLYDFGHFAFGAQQWEILCGGQTSLSDSTFEDDGDLAGYLCNRFDRWHDREG